MSTDKPFQTYEQLIEKLQTEKGLIIEDPERAIHILKQTSYFALISGYKEPFKNPDAHGKYYKGVRFSDIYMLYLLDSQLRSVFMNGILIVERLLKSLLSYYFTETFGDDELSYTDVTNYNYISSNQNDVNKLVSILKDASYNMQYGYIRHYRKNHNNLPLWVLVNALTFGNISKMYELSKSQIQSKISKEITGLSEQNITSILKVMTKFRNVCAHNERLYNYRTKESIPDLSMHEILKIDKIDGHYVCGKNDLYSIFIALYYFLLKNDFNYIKDSLHDYLVVFKKVGPWLPVENVLSEMGFPLNWINNE